MPELPEVETVRRGLTPLLEGQQIVRVQQNRDKIRIPIPKDFVSRVEGQKVTHTERRAKYIRVYLDSGDVMIIHLGMSGRIKLIAAGNPADVEKHDHVIWETARGDMIIYNDPRRFGIITICAEDELADHDLFCKMGPEPLGNEFHADYLAEKFQGRKVPVKNLLLDQRIVVGLGNIYVCEALFYAGISPMEQGGNVPREKIDILVPIIRDVLDKAIAAGGSTLKDYAQVDGELGYFQHQFATYGREGELCQTKGCQSLIERITQSGRSTFYCPTCQPLLR